MTKLLLIVSALLYLVLVTLALRPAIDLEVARLFYTGPHHFVGETPAGTVGRYVLWACPFVVLVILLAVTLLARLKLLPPQFALKLRSLAFLLLCLVIGPWLVVHVTLKEVSHRPRPYSVADFGGSDTFRPFYSFDGACRHDCAFPSGEMAVTTWMVAPASLAPPPWRGAALAAAFVFAAATGGWRMALGAHFLSDVCAGALVTILTVLVSRALLRLSDRRQQR